MKTSQKTIRTQAWLQVPGLRSWRWMALLILSVVVLAGCGGGASTETNVNTQTPQVVTYSGPVAATEDIRSFQVNFWENVRATNRCGNCHGSGQDPQFARNDDVNLAYSAAITKVDLTSPADSLLVNKVRGGHNCWLASDNACADILTAYIAAWATASGNTTSKTIQLTAPTLYDPGNSKTFPDSSAGFASTVHPLLTQYCSGCHVENSPTPQAPYFANPDADLAYSAVRAAQKINLDDPASSRLVVRLRQEFHNCWSGNCTNDAQTMENAITAFANGITPTQIDPSLVVSKALRITDAIVASGGNRHEANIIALWEFKTGSGGIAYDTSGVEPALNLTLSGQYGWVRGYGVEFFGGTAKAQGTTASSKKLHDFIKASGEYSIEAWVIPGNVTQVGPASIISYSAGVDNRNMTIGQTMYNYNFAHRSSTTDNNGMPMHSTRDADRILQATLQHVVLTFDPVNGRRVYVDGVLAPGADATTPGNLIDWDDTYAFVLGNEVSGNRPWMGKLRLVAVHNRALNLAQVQQNFQAGVGEKYFLLFSVSNLTGINQSYVMFEVSEFDNYSYLFSQPKFISLDSAASVSGSLPIQAMRIGVNGREVSVGQAYRNLDVTLSASDDIQAGVDLSALGTVIASEKGADSDQFFLTFERLGSNTNVVTEPNNLTPVAPSFTTADLQSDIGLRTFEEVDAAMSALTGVPRTDSAVRATYNTVKQQLPTVESIEGFLAAHQMAVSQMAIEYCSAMVDDDALRANFFNSFETSVGINTSAGTAFNAGNRPLVISALSGKMVGTGLSAQPDISTDIDNLLIQLSTCSGCDTVPRTRIVLKAACSATLGSAVMLIQ